MDNHYLKERQKLLDKYFPKRSAKVLSDIQSYVEEKTGITGIKDIPVADGHADNAYYNISGQRVASPSKGIYICNGKKVLIK